MLVCICTYCAIVNLIVETKRGVNNEDVKFNFDLNTQYYMECNSVIDEDINNIVNNDNKD